MFLIDKPYVSDFLKKTLHENSIPVVNRFKPDELELLEGTNVLTPKRAIERADKNIMLYTNSENSIGWVSEHLGFTGIPDKIDLFKDKFKFRELTAELFPGFFYKKVNISELDKIDIDNLPLPFIIKPTVGFFSMGVYRVSSDAEWTETKDKIEIEIKNIKDMYPDEVLDFSTFIIEECIDGNEYAIDAYYNQNGEPVILNILEHSFSSDSDVSDRIYMSSKKIIESNIDEFLSFLKEVGKLADVINFPCHIELRRDEVGRLIPIEINPMRFGGWCTTADFTYYSYGFNPYLYYYKQLKPDWKEILKDKEDSIYSLVVLDNSTGLDRRDIEAFDYIKLLSHFENPLELREIDFKLHPVFGFLFTETRKDNLEELERILKSDLTEYITVK